MIKKADLSDSKRHLRVAEQLKRVVSESLNKGKVLLHVVGDIHLTVSEVRVSSDLKFARVFVFPSNKDDAAEIIGLINEYSREVHKYLRRAVNLKFLPKLHFVYDDMFDKAQEVENLLHTTDNGE